MSNRVFLLSISVFFICFRSYSQENLLDNIKVKYNNAVNDFELFESEHRGYVETANGKFHFLTWGNPEDMPIIWIHGSYTNAYEIKLVADLIVNNGYYLIAIDYYGHGLTPIPDHEVSLYHVADDIKNLMVHKNIEKAVIGGWSRGAYIATAFYDSYPDKVFGLILEDGGSVAFNTFYHSLEEKELLKYIGRMFENRMIYSKFPSEFEVYKEYHDPENSGSQFELLAWISQDKEGLYTIAPGLEELFNMANPLQAIDNILRPTKSPLFAKSIAMMEPSIIYRNLSVPMLIMDPTHRGDIFPFEKENEILKSQHPALITHLQYEDTGHNIHFEKPEIFVKDLLDFLTRLRKSYAIYKE